MHNGINEGVSDLLVKIKMNDKVLKIQPLKKTSFKKKIEIWMQLKLRNAFEENWSTLMLQDLQVYAMQKSIKLLHV